MLARSDGRREEEEDGDDEGSERLLMGLTHQCSLTLQVQGLPTGFCRDIHGQVSGIRVEHACSHTSDHGPRMLRTAEDGAAMKDSFPQLIFFPPFLKLNDFCPTKSFYGRR